VLFLLSCATGGRTGAPSASTSDQQIETRAGSLTVYFEDRLRWPYRLEGLRVLLDGEAILIDSDGDGIGGIIGMVPASEGADLTLWAEAHVSYPTGAARETCRLRLLEALVFRVEDDSPAAHLQLSQRGVGHDFTRRPRFEARLEGANVVPEDEARELFRGPTNDRCVLPVQGPEGCRGNEIADLMDPVSDVESGH